MCAARNFPVQKQSFHCAAAAPAGTAAPSSARSQAQGSPAGSESSELWQCPVRGCDVPTHFFSISLTQISFFGELSASKQQRKEEQ